MSMILYYIICAVLSVVILAGIYMMSKVETAAKGNRLSAIGVLAGVIVTLLHYNILPVYSIYIFIAIGFIIGIRMATRVKMIEMPQMVALLNGIGGAASAIVGSISFIQLEAYETSSPLFGIATALLAIIIGMVTFVGSLIAAGKLSKRLAQKPVVYKGHQAWTLLFGLLSIAPIIYFIITGVSGLDVINFIINPNIAYSYLAILIGTIICSGLFGYFFSIRVGGADMPITISLLNSLSGVAGAIAGMAINDLLLVSVGGIVGASGLLLTQIMCRAMNRSLIDILMGSSKKITPATKSAPSTPAPTPQPASPTSSKYSIADAKEVIIVPGYGMALAQAQHQVKQLADELEAKGAHVRFAIHPVAGRMPGHMNVLLAEANVPYEELYEMEQINDDFAKTDLVIVIGANDVINPAAREAEGTPIYGMPVLDVDKAKNVIVCNYDTKPGYAGVDNPLYKSAKTEMILGDAKESLKKLLEELRSGAKSTTPASTEPVDDTARLLQNSKEVIIVPGYGMALAQAQHQVKQLADQLEAKGTHVRFAIHPVAGRMPGHMNVLLAEANVPYEELYEMEQINDDFAKADLVIVIGANDVINPAAREAEGTPIYGMPVLDVDKAKNVIVCNFDTKPGYAGVDNPLYKSSKTKLMLGDAKESLKKLVEDLHKKTASTEAAAPKENNIGQLIQSAKEVIIVPGYGMALAQAQHQVKQLADQLEAKGAHVRFAIHPVAGRMPGHMNVLLAEANVPYEELYEMEQINDDFAKTDLVIIIGANDVVNPAAREAEGTPIYGMPVLDADKAKHVIVCNFDTKPGYAGVDNPLYKSPKTEMMLGDAKESLKKLSEELHKSVQPAEEPKRDGKQSLEDIIKNSKEVIIVPGYGMALAQAQHQVKQLADQLEGKGAHVRFAIHPVAGRMPGHMNVLLAEANVPYDELNEMEQINDDFEKTDLVIVIGANDVINPAAREAEGTPIYGMPVLNADKAKHVIVCNFDTKPGYAGVDNPLYKLDTTIMLLGDAKESLKKIIAAL